MATMCKPKSPLEDALLIDSHKSNFGTTTKSNVEWALEKAHDQEPNV